MRWLLGLLAATVVLIAVMAWQAYAAAVSHRVLAERVLHDYADLAATELVRRSTSFIGNYGFGASIRALRRAAESSDTRTSASSGGSDSAKNGAGGALPSRAAIAAALPVQSKRAMEFVGTLIRFDTEGRRFETAFQNGGEAIGEEVRRALIARARLKMERPFEYRVLHFISDDGGTSVRVPGAGPKRTRTFVFTADDVGQESGAARLGYEMRPEALRQWLTEFILPEPLLPLSLASRDAAQSSLHVIVRSPDGGVFLTFPERSDRSEASERSGRELARERIRAQRPMEDRAENSLAEFSVDVAIDPAAAHRLVIGGLPESRVGVLLTLLVVAIGLSAAAVVQIGRERALARLREDFVTRVSHELRTPVARIRMFTDTLLLDRFRSEDERRRSLEAIDRGSRRLAYLIDNVMQFAKHRHPGLRGEAAAAVGGEPIDLCLLAREVIDDFDAMTDAQARPCIQLRCEGNASAPVSIDREAFQQILTNLLDNAAKYAGCGGGVRVEIEGCELRVIDGGPGIPARDRERVWEPYVRLDRDRRSSIAGAGIGLAVVHDLVSRAGGRCRIEDTPNGGATVIITFANSADSTAARAAAGAAAAPARDGSA